MKSLFCSLTFALFIGLSTPAMADGYVKFPNSGLYCVISETSYSLVTVQNNGNRITRTIKQFKSKIRSGKRKIVDARAELQQRLNSAPASRRAKIKAAIAAANQAIKILNESTAFAESCGSGALNSFAIQAPLPTGGSFGGGTKK